jgi:hypothetical protein
VAVAELIAIAPVAIRAPQQASEIDGVAAVARRPKSAGPATKPTSWVTEQ